MTEANLHTTSTSDRMPPSIPARAATRCRCGHTRNDPEVLPEPFYTGWGWLLFLIGVTAKPLAVLYRCLWCKQVIARTRDPMILSRFD